MRGFDLAFLFPKQRFGVLSSELSSVGWLDAWRVKEESDMLLAGVGDLELSRAVVVVSNPTPRLETYAQLLRRRVEQSSRCRWRRSGDGPKVFLSIEPQAVEHPEGFLLEVEEGSVHIVGGSERGVLFGVGRFLREMTLDYQQSYATPLKQSAFCPANLYVQSHPDYPIRWHQIAYRPKTNSYDAFSVEDMKREIADIAIFGGNGVEMIPPGLDDASQSPHFQVPWLEMLEQATAWCDELDLNVSLWFPLFPGSDQEHWGRVFSSMRRLDSLFVPGGDPGGRRATELFRWVKEKAAFMRKNFFPDAEVWVSSQYGLGVSVDHGLESWDPAQRLSEWFAELRLPRTREFLDGVVYGPWSALPLEEFRGQVPEGYKFRNYPDICHSASCEHPVRGWDPIFATTYLREGINPRPRVQADIIRAQAPLTDGCGCYSEGVNDDLNKVVWSALHWGADQVGPLSCESALLHGVLKQYAGLFLQLPRWSETVVEMLYSLEEHWESSLDMERVLATHLRLKSLPLTPDHQRNWRVNLLFLRAEFDAFLVTRFQAELQNATRATDCLSEGVEAFEIALESPYPAPAARLGEVSEVARRALEVERFASLLFSQVGYQTTLRFGGQHRQRGAFLENAWIPLGDLNFFKRVATEARDETDPVLHVRRELRLDFRPLWYLSFGEDDSTVVLPPYRPFSPGEDPVGFRTPFIEHLATDDDEILQRLKDGQVRRAWRSWVICIWPQTAVLELRIPLDQGGSGARSLGLTWVGPELNRLGGDWAELGRRVLPTRLSVGHRTIQDFFVPEQTESRTYRLFSEELAGRFLTLLIEPQDRTKVGVTSVPVPVAELWLE